jgi:hypothetical protein
MSRLNCNLGALLTERYCRHLPLHSWPTETPKELLSEGFFDENLVTPMWRCSWFGVSGVRPVTAGGKWRSFAAVDVALLVGKRS